MVVNHRHPWEFLRIPFRVGESYGLWTGDDGTPVWPVGDSADLAVLSEVCRVHGGRAVEDNRARWKAGAALPSYAGDVLSLGEAAERPGCLYAHLTGRRHRHEHDTGALKLPQALEVVVASADRVSYDLLEDLYDPGRFPKAPGLIIGVTEVELRRHALIRSAAAALQPLRLEKLVHFELQVAIDERRLPDRRLIGCKAASSYIGQTMADAGDLLIVGATSDGVDANLGNRVLCSLISLPSEDRIGNAPKCLNTGTCYRLRVPLEQAFLSGRLLAPTNIAARVVLLRVCFGLLPRGSLHDFRYSFLRQIACNPSVAIVLAGWGVVFTSPYDTDVLVQSLSSGIPVGEAVARFNSSESARSTGDRLSLIGDPTFRFKQADPVPDPDFRRDPGYDAVTWDDGAEHKRCGSRELTTTKKSVDFLKAYLTLAADSRSDEASGLFNTALETIEAWGRLPQDSDGQMAVRMRDEVLLAVVAGGTMPCKGWLSVARTFRAQRSAGPCLVCGIPANRIEIELRLPGNPRRRLLNCPRCGVVEDAEFDAPPVAVVVESNTAVRLTLSEEHGPWAAALTVEGSGGMGSWSWPCGAGERIGLTHLFRLPRMPGPLASFIGLFLMDGARLTIVRTPLLPGEYVGSRGVGTL